jgi:predicted NBD/HSP70 family sugar kinase
MPKTLVKARQAGRYSKVFDLIRRNNGQLSRFDICKLTGYSTTTVTAVVDRLIADGLVVEDESQESRVGRRPSLLNIQCDSVFFAGIECNAMGVNLTVTDASQAIVLQSSTSLDSPQTEEILAAMKALLDQFIQENPEIWEKTPSVTFSIPGKLNTKTGVGIQYRTVPDWHDVDFSAQFAYLGKRLIFLNNVDAMLTGYRTEHNLGPDRSVMFLIIRNSAGVRLFSKGMLCSELGIVCEIGHMKAEGSTRWCACGKKGCFDAELSSTAMVSKLREAHYAGLLDENMLSGDSELTLDTLFRLVEQGEPTAERLLVEAGDFLFQMLNILLAFFRPDIVVLSSFYPESICHFSEMLQTRLAEHLEDDKMPEITCIPPANALASFGATIVGYETAFPNKVTEI